MLIWDIFKISKRLKRNFKEALSNMPIEGAARAVSFPPDLNAAVFLLDDSETESESVIEIRSKWSPLAMKLMIFGLCLYRQG